MRYTRIGYVSRVPYPKYFPSDPVAFTDIVEVVRTRFELQTLALVGDRGMITAARIDAIRELNNNPDTATDFDWITALRAPAIATLAANDGLLQPGRSRLISNIAKWLAAGQFPSAVGRYGFYQVVASENANAVGDILTCPDARSSPNEPPSSQRGRAARKSVRCTWF